jgi:predicted lipoprotein with Yx(FWY)xxD motif
MNASALYRCSDDPVKKGLANLRAITVQQTANGNQVKYNDHLLYTYISDGSPGEVTGDNVNGWFVAVADLS